jgi:hypothetical protein
LAGRRQRKTSLNAIPEHSSGADDRQGIDEMMNSAGDRRNMRVFVQDELVVRNGFGALGDDIAITYLCDVVRPPLPPPAVPPKSPTKRVEPFEPLSVIDQVGTEMLKVSPALDDEHIPEMRAFAHVSTEFTHGVEPREPLSASDQVVAEMFAVPPALQMFHETTSPPTNRVEPFEPLSVFGQVGTEVLKVSPALEHKDTHEMVAFTPAFSELIHGAEPREPLSASDQVVRCAPCAPGVPQNDIARRHDR